LSVPKTYAELRRGVEAALLTGQRNIEQAKVRTYWETGRLIQEHLRLNTGRADYGAQVIPRLSRDLEIAERTLYSCVHFVAYFPIPRARAELTWAHYRLLCQVDDPAQRAVLLKAAIKEGWTSDDLEARVRDVNALALAQAGAKASAGSPPPARLTLLTAKRGTPGLHLITARGDGLVVDLGFKLYRPLPPEQARRYARGDIVRVDDDGSVRRDDRATKADLFTYAATVLRVIDGDTLVVALHVTPDVVLEEKLRLRGLDCPELKTPEGKAAKRFVDGLLTPGADVVLTTTKPDKYDRYLADLFVGGTKDHGPEARGVSSQLPSFNSQLLAHGEVVFLNNALLENGHAVRKDAWEFADWDKDLLT
jgi:endonuclease YncB( thermonuclease family)